MNDLISIVTVCYNAEEAIKKTMESVLIQTYRPLEYILIDGQSTDNTLSVIREMEPLFVEKGIHFHCQSEKDHGIFDAMNKGIGIAKGEWINFMNAGDIFYSPNAIEKLFGYTTIENDIKIVYGDTFRKKSYGIVASKGYAPEETLRLMPACHQSIFARTTEMQATPFDLSYKLAADYHFVYSLYKRGGKLKYIPVDVSLCEAVEGVTSVNTLSVKRECARIRGIEQTIQWKLWFFSKTIAFYCNRFFMKLLPYSYIIAIKQWNRKRKSKH